MERSQTLLAGLGSAGRLSWKRSCLVRLDGTLREGKAGGLKARPSRAHNLGGIGAPLSEQMATRERTCESSQATARAQTRYRHDRQEARLHNSDHFALFWFRGFLGGMPFLSWSARVSLRYAASTTLSAMFTRATKSSLDGLKAR